MRLIGLSFEGKKRERDRGRENKKKKRKKKIRKIARVSKVVLEIP
jgi:hypothetical protein